MGEPTFKEELYGMSIYVPSAELGMRPIYDRLVALVEEMKHSKTPTYTGEKLNWSYLEHVPEKCIRCRFAAILGTAALDKGGSDG